MAVFNKNRFYNRRYSSVRRGAFTIHSRPTYSQMRQTSYRIRRRIPYNPPLISAAVGGVRDAAWRLGISQMRNRLPRHVDNIISEYVGR